jgi:hypothetical protein
MYRNETSASANRPIANEELQYCPLLSSIAGNHTDTKKAMDKDKCSQEKQE